MRTSTRKNLLIAASYAAVLIAGMSLGPKFKAEDQNRTNGTFIPFLNERSGNSSDISKPANKLNEDGRKADSLKIRLQVRNSFLEEYSECQITKDFNGL